MIVDHTTTSARIAREMAALAAGQIDWWEVPPVDFIPKIERNEALRTFLFDRSGPRAGSGRTTSS